MREDLAPTGYAYEDEIKFAVNEDGIPEVVIMQDTKTDVALLKIDAVTKEPLSGGRYQVSDSNGAVVYQFTASGKPEQLIGQLIAGQSYTLEEVEPPSGYAYSKKIPFTVPQSPKTIEIVMEDKPTNLLVEKLTEAMVASPSEAEHQLSGFKLQILNADKSPAIAARTTEDFKAGEELIFTTGNQFKQLIGQLIAGQSYWLHEISPRDGYAYAEDVMFTVSLDGREDIVLMVDKPTQVIVSKKAITGDNELPGNYMSIRNMAGAVIEEWISAEDPHIITAKLVAGETYLLCEERPLEGYAYASAVKFTVSLDGTIDRIEMKNEMTKVRIIKMNSSGNHLKGAVLQVLDAQKNIVIPDFESTGDAMEITGQLTAGRLYYLHEVQAPAGYLLSADVPFTVPKGAEVVEVRMTDPKKPTSGPDVNQMYLRKVDALTGKGIGGVEFSVYQPNGNLYSVYVTGYDGYAKFDVPRDGTYTYRETQAAPGYIVTDEVYSFTIKDGRITNQSTVSVVNVPVPDIKIEKIDGVSGERLSGAKVRIWNDTWTTVELTEEDGSFTINPPAAGRYYIQEIEAPVGYKLNDTVYEFVIQLDGSITGTTVIYNYPEDGKPEKKIGRVTAVYRSGLSGRGYTEFGIPGIHVPGVKTGDDTPIRRYLLLCAASLAGIVGIVFIRRRKKK
ncbi:MAG: SpaA isopeptide-forming pilin-related protein [Clostridium sp.]